MEQSTLNFIYFLAAIGAIWFVVVLAKLLWSFVKFIIPSKNFPERYGYRSWAVVTGGSDGIGLGFCEQLAAKGFNIVMIARNRQKMQKACSAIQMLNEGTKTKIIVADFVNCQQQDFFNNISRQLEGLDISILINNVGISNIGYLHEIAPKRLLNEININCVPAVMLSSMLIPQMLNRQKRSGIIVVSSVSAQYPIPYISTYAATKAFANFFSQSIEMQYSYKIDILSLKPMYVESNMSKQEKSCTVASRNQCASAALSYLGIDYQTNGYIVHRILAWLTRALPTPVLRCAAESSSRKIMQNQKQEK